MAAVKAEDDSIQQKTERNSAARANQEWDAKKKAINRICQEIIK